SRQEVVDLVTAHGERLSEGFVQPYAFGVSRRARDAFADVEPGAKLGLGSELAVYETRKLVSREMRYPHLSLRRMTSLGRRIFGPELLPSPPDPALDPGRAAMFNLCDLFV